MVLIKIRKGELLTPYRSCMLLIMPDILELF